MSTPKFTTAQREILLGLYKGRVLERVGGEFPFAYVLRRQDQVRGVYHLSAPVQGLFQRELLQVRADQDVRLALTWSGYQEAERLAKSIAA